MDRYGSKELFINKLNPKKPLPAPKSGAVYGLPMGRIA